jgi:phage gp36-like protein
MYCTQADIEKRIGLAELLQLTDRSRSGQIDTDAVAAAIVDAATELEVYLTGRYTLPFASIPPALVPLAVSLAVYNLFSARRGGGMIDDVRNRYRDAIRLLEKINSGEVSLGVVPVSTVTETEIVMQSAPSVWSRTPLGDI